MDPLLLAQLWWLAPAAIGAGTVSWLGLRGQRTAGARRLAVEAAKLDVRSAREAVTRGNADVAVAHAELMRAKAERATPRGSERAVIEARRLLQDARQNAKSAMAGLRARQAGLRAARGTVPSPRADPEDFPLAKVVGAHNAVLVRWMEYETDAAKLIAYPAMSDGGSPVLAEFLHAHSQAQWLRPSSADARITPAEFAAYRDAVKRVELTFNAAERDVTRAASGRPYSAFSAAGAGAWVDTAHDLLLNAQRAIAWSAEVVARVSDGAATASERFPRPSTKPRPASRKNPTPPSAPRTTDADSD